jgi:hypothetical protein
MPAEQPALRVQSGAARGSRWPVAGDAHGAFTAEAREALDRLRAGRIDVDAPVAEAQRGGGHDHEELVEMGDVEDEDELCPSEDEDELWSSADEDEVWPPYEDEDVEERSDELAPVLVELGALPAEDEVWPPYEDEDVEELLDELAPVLVELGVLLAEDEAAALRSAALRSAGSRPVAIWTVNAAEIATNRTAASTIARRRRRHLLRLCARSLSAPVWRASLSRERLIGWVGEGRGGWLKS